MTDRASLVLYRSLTRLAGAAARPAAPLDPALRERLALDELPRMPGAIWVHAASVGELNSARLIITALAAARPVLVTANSRTGRALARGWGLAARLAPLDAPQAVARFLDALRPVLAVTVENEIWPSRSAALRARGIGQAVIGARMSARSARRWARARGLIAPVLGGIDLLSAQDAATEGRLIGLGLRAGALAPRTNLKLMGPARMIPPLTARRGERSGSPPRPIRARMRRRLTPIWRCGSAVRAQGWSWRRAIRGGPMRLRR
ncbi:3-deoxy-D-manno-octulosonic acid transferase [Paracoccus contaminans]|uniref:3-deoxy-D-manno-octulosonic acid transferase n=1 Tax=Paracoccus contaminans TaxID=1945662 RepID=UPI001F0A7E7A|nr:glycosyltransferase N-terminal domain-containing protein [Paracoccus contaminans]